MANLGYPMTFPNYNEEGEPLISGEALRFEQELDSDPANYWCDDCGVTHYGECRVDYTDDSDDWDE